MGGSRADTVLTAVGQVVVSEADRHPTVGVVDTATTWRRAQRFESGREVPSSCGFGAGDAGGAWLESGPGEVLLASVSWSCR